VAHWQAVLTALNILLLALLLAGLLVRGRSQRLRSLSVYVVVTLVTALGALLWPARVHVWSFWLAKETILRVLGTLVIVEVLVRIFARMPTARQAAHRTLAASLLMTTAALVSIGPSARTEAVGANPWMLALVVDVLPRLAFASALLVLFVLALTLVYMVPLDPLHRAVLYGLAPYLTLYALTVGSMTDAARHALANLANGLAYPLMLLLWVHAAWRSEPTPPVGGDVVRWVQPWR
jgi:hypothetical protein